MTDKKTSLLVNYQVPSFVRDEHPKFISFLEAYYEFLDQNGYGKSKDLRDLPDVDKSLEEFEQQFFNSFLPFIPRDTPVSKEFIIKNILPLYLSKGSENSYRLLFRLLFGEEISIERPGNQVLRASDGRWKVESYLRTELDIISRYVSDGVQTTYFLPYELDPSGIEVYVDDVLVSNFIIRKEYKKLIFNSAPSENSTIEFKYASFDTSVLENRKINGTVSGASAIIERVGKRSIGGLTFYQFFIDKKTTLGTFENGELLQTDVLLKDNLIPILIQSYSDLEKINIVNGGANYNIGDPVIVRGISNKSAIAIIDGVTTGAVDEIQVVDGGSGFLLNSNVTSENIDTSLFFAKVSLIDDSGKLTSNTISFNTDLISNFSNISIGSADYGFPAAGTENVNTVIAQALTTNTVNGFGSIVSINVETSKITSQSNPQIIVEPPVLFSNVSIEQLGIIGEINIVSGGTNYNVGEYLIFTNELSFGGQGANAYVSNVSVNGTITQITINDGGLSYDIDYPPTITVDTANGSNAVLSVGSIMGKQPILLPEVVDDILGRITSIRVLESGVGYTTDPIIDLTRSGNGQAVGEPILRNTLVDLSGKWTTTDSLLSTDDIRLQGRDYYINYAYVISSKIEFDTYKSLLKNLLHPSGYINYSKFRIFETANSQQNYNVTTSLIKTVSGTINFANGSNTIIGVNSNFITAQTLGIIETGNVIAVGNFVAEIVSINTANTIVVSNIVTQYSNSENNITTSTFTYSSNGDIIKILS